MTELSKQLLQLKSLSESVQSSFLFDPKTAAKIDKDIIFTIGMNGFEELRDEDDNFTLFFSELFDESYAMSHCAQETLLKSEIDFLHSELLKVNALIVPHFLKPGCHKIMEFLIRFYKYHQLIKDEILFSLLPFHGTKYFIRFLMTCQLDGFWHFLTRHQKTGFIMNRSDIVRQSIHELSLLKGILNKADLSEVHKKFAVAVCLEVVQVVSRLSEALMIVLMNFVDKMIARGGVDKEFAMVIIGQIALRHPFSPQYLQGVIGDLLVEEDSDAVKEVLTVNFLAGKHVRDI